ncbi:hypothetical protein KY290_010621 [Solanum tuberosum]|uniref:Uncharacterized protein n=1 Tax=Solanum tuberosum TaxID=4113 RepID=A0ABQ7VYA9_SOLTU|nr:hypothetical protein KY290_010621 [Solanum tuberosum]
MTTLLVLIHHNGEWDSDNNFVNYSMEGIVVNTDVVFNGFIQLIAKHLNVDTSLNSLEIRYKLDETTIPMLIRNNMGLQVYIGLKKKTRNFKDYPLCITWKVIDIHHMVPITDGVVDNVNTHFNTNDFNNTNTLDLVEYNMSA